MAAGRANLTIEQGATFEQKLLWKDEEDTPIDTSGMTARLQARRRITASSAVVELTTENGGIELGLTGSGDNAYNVRLLMSAADTSELPASASSRKWPYDLEIVNGPAVTRLLKGKLVIDLEVTR